MCFLSSCIETVDLYVSTESGNDTELSTEDFILADVPDGFDWKMIRSLDVSVQLADGDVDALVEFFSEDPVDNTDAVLLGSCIVRNGSVYSRKLTIPNTLTNVYVRKS